MSAFELHVLRVTRAQRAVNADRTVETVEAEAPCSPIKARVYRARPSYSDLKESSGRAVADRLVVSVAGALQIKDIQSGDTIHLPASILGFPATATVVRARPYSSGVQIDVELITAQKDL